MDTRHQVPEPSWQLDECWSHLTRCLVQLNISYTHLTSTTLLKNLRCQRSHVLIVQSIHPFWSMFEDPSFWSLQSTSSSISKISNSPLVTVTGSFPKTYRVNPKRLFLGGWHLSLDKIAFMASRLFPGKQYNKNRLYLRTIYSFNFRAKCILIYIVSFKWGVNHGHKLTLISTGSLYIFPRN